MYDIRDHGGKFGGSGRSSNIKTTDLPQFDGRKIAYTRYLNSTGDSSVYERGEVFEFRVDEETNSIYTCHSNQEGPLDERGIYFITKLNLQMKILWRVQLAGGVNSHKRGKVTNITSKGNTVFVISSNRTIVKLNASNGSIQGYFTVQHPTHNLAEMIVANDNADTLFIFAKRTGTTSTLMLFEVDFSGLILKTIRTGTVASDHTNIMSLDQDDTHIYYLVDNHTLRKRSKVTGSENSTTINATAYFLNVRCERSLLYINSNQHEWMLVLNKDLSTYYSRVPTSTSSGGVIPLIVHPELTAVALNDPSSGFFSEINFINIPSGSSAGKLFGLSHVAHIQQKTISGRETSPAYRRLNYVYNCKKTNDVYIAEPINDFRDQGSGAYSQPGITRITDTFDIFD